MRPVEKILTVMYVIAFIVLFLDMVHWRAYV
jgi:hypothetical protein